MLILKNELKKHLKKEGISNPENPTEFDLNKILKIPLEGLDEALIKEYYKFIADVLPHLMEMMGNLSSQNLGKHVINSFQKRIDILNERWLLEKDYQILEMIRKEISEINDRIENESDKQRNWLTGLAYAVLGTIVILGGLLISVKFKDAGQKIIEVGKKQIQG